MLIFSHILAKHFQGEGVDFWNADRIYKRDFTYNSSYPYTTYQRWIVGTEGKKADPTALRLGAPEKY